MTFKRLFALLCSASFVACSTLTPNENSYRSVAATGQFFSGEINSIELSYPVDALIKQLKADTLSEHKIAGTMTWIEKGVKKTIPVEVAVRGQSSRDDCDFPKLSVDFKKSDIANTDFDGLSKLRLNTHCGEAKDKKTYTEMGRIKGDAGPIREAMAYKLQEVAGLKGYLHKLIDVKYYDTDTKKSLSHKAVALESKKNLMKRLGYVTMYEENSYNELETEGPDAYGSDENWPDPAIATVPREEQLKAVMLQALLGNNDYSLGIADLQGARRNFQPVPITPFWNMPLLIKEDKKQGMFLVTDFDMSFVVRQAPFSEEPLQKLTKCPDFYCYWSFFDVQKWRAFFEPSLFKNVTAHYKSKKTLLHKAVDEFDTKLLSKNEKVYFKKMIDGLLFNLDTMYSQPVIASPDIQVYPTSDLTKPPCGDEGEDKWDITVPVGMPVFPLKMTAQEEAQSKKQASKPIKVMIFEVRDQSMRHMDTLDSCVKAPVWIDGKTEITPNWPN